MDYKRLTDNELEQQLLALDKELERRKSMRIEIAKKTDEEIRMEGYRVKQEDIKFSKRVNGFSKLIRTFSTKYNTQSWKDDPKIIRGGEDYLSMELEHEHKIRLAYDEKTDKVLVEVRDYCWSTAEEEFDRKLLFAFIDLFKREVGGKFKNL